MSTRLVWKAVDSGAGEASTLSGVKVSLWHPIIVSLYQSWTLLGSSVEDRRWTNLTSWASPERSSLGLKEQGGSGEGEIMMVLTKSLNLEREAPLLTPLQSRNFFASHSA